LNIFSDCFGLENIRTSFRMGFFSLDPKGGSNPLEALSQQQHLLSTTKVARSISSHPRTSHHALPDYRVIDLSYNPSFGISKDGKTKDAYHFFIVYAEAADPKELKIVRNVKDGKPDYTQTYKNDLKSGIYHLYIGRDRGLVKNISFAKTDQEYLREQRFTQESEINPYAILSNVFDVTIQMYGNNLFYPGQRIFIYPSGGFSSLGHPWVRGTYSSTLGLGGYHIVTEVSSKIESGKFETTLKARWETSGDGISQDPSVNQSRGTGTYVPSGPSPLPVEPPA